MTQEEKAKAYDKAIERAKGILNVNPSHTSLGNIMENIFPELRESEDERIRKVLCDIVRDAPYMETKLRAHGLTVEKILAYLEKQKEQKSIESVAVEATKDKDSATKFLKSAGIMDDNGELAEMYRSEQKPAEWSEEDKVILNAAIEMVDNSDTIFCFEVNKYKVKNWLKSLRPCQPCDVDDNDKEREERMVENYAEGRES